MEEAHVSFQQQEDEANLAALQSTQEEADGLQTNMKRTLQDTLATMGDNRQPQQASAPVAP